MKKLSITTVGATILLAAGVQAATNTLSVSASVSGTCKFNTDTSTLAFGALDPSAAVDATASTSITYRCTKGTAATTTANNGSNASGTQKRLSNGAATPEYINYALSLNGGSQTGTGHGAGKDLTLSVSGTITAASYENATAGSYTDSVTLTLTP